MISSPRPRGGDRCFYIVETANRREDATKVGCHGVDPLDQQRIEQAIENSIALVPPDDDAPEFLLVAA
jgi:hypothetical protein